MLAHDARSNPVAAARQILDRFGVPERLRHVEQYVWRGGTLRFGVDDRPDAPPKVFYELRAEWPAAVLAPIASDAGLIRDATPVVVGRWTRGTTGYVLRLGIDLARPVSIYLEAERLLSVVPFVNRPPADVEHALAADLRAYVEWFLSACQPVPRRQSDQK